MWVFREGKRHRRCSELLRELRSALSSASARFRAQDEALDALMRAGQLEAAAADVGVSGRHLLSTVTDAVAASWLGVDHGFLGPAYHVLDYVTLPESLSVSIPEGFAYYALHPRDYASAASELGEAGPYAVIGIRSIGATLSSVVMTALRQAGHRAERMTVRPGGHPFERTLRLAPLEIGWIRRQHRGAAHFLIVDEGPGLSGSSFIAVGEALLGAGVPADHITLLGSREPDIRNLRAQNAGPRWRQFRWRHAKPRAFQYLDPEKYAGSGRWRELLLSNRGSWPAVWTQMERMKFLSPGAGEFLKFEGFGHLGQVARARSAQVAEAGFGCPCEDAGDGLAIYPLLPGRPMHQDDVNAALLDRVADYCAFRRSAFQNGTPAGESLEVMLLGNLEEEFGPAASAAVQGSGLEALRQNESVVVDGHMQPHEWIQLDDGTVLKTDVASHGDDHFFPGPTDIAWDLAGANIEWDLSPAARDYLIERYRQGCRDDPARRIDIFELAYAAFRMGYCKLAMQAEAGGDEENRLRGRYLYYRSKLRKRLAGAAKAA